MTAGTQRRIAIATLLDQAVVGTPVEATGWVKTSRFSKNVSFLHLYDGSDNRTVQVVLPQELAEDLKKDLGVGTAVRVQGEWVDSPGGKQSVEIRAAQLEIVGHSDAAEYPLQKKRTSMEHLRTIAHLRSRTNTHQAVVRVRNAVS